MNYAQYMRKVAQTQPKIIPYQGLKDASMVTMKAQARAQTTKTTTSVETTFSQVGGSIANVLETSQQTCVPTNSVCSSGYKGFASGESNRDSTASVIGASVHCAVCSDPPTSEPYCITIPCATYTVNGEVRSNNFIDPPKNAPGQTKCCLKDAGGLLVSNSELVADEGRQLTIRKNYNLPNKLQGLRGPISYQ